MSCKKHKKKNCQCQPIILLKEKDLDYFIHSDGPIAVKKKTTAP